MKIISFGVPQEGEVTGWGGQTEGKNGYGQGPDEDNG